MTLNDFIYLL